jgi:2-dehydropantoate 2-reductase
MNILIIGAGAMGCLFGALLAPVSRVGVFCSQQKLAALLQTRGILVDETDQASKKLIVQAGSRVTEFIADFDCALICTKNDGTKSAAATAKELLKPEGFILTLQNGLGNREKIVAQMGEQRTLVGITAQAATLIAPGHVRHAGAGTTQISPQAGQERIGRIISDLFHQAGIATTMVANLDSLLWSKLIVNAAINPLAAILRLTNGELAENPYCRILMKQVVEEAAAVAKAKHVDLPYEKLFEQVMAVCAQTASNRASMLQDILRQRKTEVEAINGAISSLAEEVGVKTPINTCITELILALASTAQNRIA